MSDGCVGSQEADVRQLVVGGLVAEEPAQADAVGFEQGIASVDPDAVDADGGSVLREVRRRSLRVVVVEAELDVADKRFKSALGIVGEGV